jgi:hypothetical protein
MVILDNEIKFAKTLLETYTPEEVSNLILYTLDAAPRKKVEIRSFGGVKIFMNDWLNENATKTKRAALEQKKKAEQREERLRDAYELWCRAEIKKLRETVAPEELAALIDAATAEMKQEHQHRMGFETMVRLRTDKLLEERHPMQSYEDWKATAT